MWLLDARTLRLVKIADEKKIHGKYAILSHTWEEEDDEVSFNDIHRSYATSMKGYKKIKFTCDQAVRDGIQYVWVDTCCIDKKSSAELSEAINAMFRWYYKAAACYAYLSDVSFSREESTENSIVGNTEQQTRISRVGVHLQASRWFSRGWTLQELIAPSSVEFYDSTWVSMGTKAQLVNHLSVISKIPTYVLENRDRLAQTSIAQRMSWAAGRSTSRIEDQAYALLGIFGISMPLVYGGEGSKAFTQLQEMIIQTSPREDHSLLVWPSERGYLLAPSPDAFTQGDQIVSRAHCLDETFELSNKGLRVTLLARPDKDTDGHMSDHSSRNNERYAETITVALNCQYEHHANGHLIALRLRRRPRVHTLGLKEQQYNVLGEVTYDRMTEMTTITPEELRQFTAMTLTIARRPYSWPAIARRISISDDSTVAHASQYAPQGHSRDAMQGVRGFFGLHILNTSVAFSRLIIRSPQGHWKDAVLAIGMVYSETPPRLLVHAFEDGQHEALERLDVFKLCRVIREGEERLFEVAGVQSLRVAARYVLIGGELMWNLEIGRPKVPSGMDLARSPIEIRRGLEYPELGVDPTIPRVLVPGNRHGLLRSGVQEASRYPTPPPVMAQSRATHSALPMLNTNLPPHLSGPSLEMGSPVLPASSIDVKQYWQQQQFLAELYLAHVQKQEQASRPDLLPNGRHSRSVSGRSSTIRQTRLVRFMHSKMHRLFKAHLSVNQSENLLQGTNHPALEEPSTYSNTLIPELEAPHTTSELPANVRSHEISDTRQHAELPAVPAIHALDSNPVYELDSTPCRSLSVEHTSSSVIPEISPTTISAEGLQDRPIVRRRFSWELPLEEPTLSLSELPAQGRSTRLTLETSSRDSRQPDSLPAYSETDDRGRSITDLVMLADQNALSRFLRPQLTHMARPLSAAT